MTPTTVTATLITNPSEDGTPGLIRFGRDTTGSPLEVQFGVGGTATPGSDFTSLPGSVTFGASNATVDLPINALPDNVTDPSETVVITIAGSPFYTPGSPAVATATITDTTPVVTVAQYSNATEGSADGVIQFTRTGSTTGTLTVNYTVGGTATAGVRYIPLSGTVTFEAGSSTANVAVTAVDDLAYNAPATVTVTLQGGSNYAVGGGNFASVTITDDDLAPAYQSYWKGVSADWTAAQNWTGAVPGSGTAAYFDPLQLVGQNPHLDVTLPTGAITLAELHFVNGYSGTVTLGVGTTLTVNKLELTTGAIAQDSAGSDLSVLNHFIWTGGILNSAASNATFHLIGAKATIDPGAGNTITTGSTLSFENNGTVGSTVSINPGSVEFAGGGGMTVDDLCFVNAAPKKTASVQFKTPTGTPPEEDGKRITLNTGAKYRVFGEDDFPETGEPDLAVFTSKLPLQNSGGTFTVEKAATATFNGKLTHADDNTKFGSFFQWGGTTNIESGSDLTVENGVQIMGGNLYTRAHPTLSAAKQIATIFGDLRIAQLEGNPAVTISICEGSNPHKYGFFAVTGSVDWKAGTFKPQVDATDQNKVDDWIILGNLSVGGTAKVAPVTLNYNPNLGIGATFRATFLAASGGINGNATVEGTAPTYQIFVLQPGGTERRWALGPG